jgi:predicted AAA+ superfamily ATPase
MAGHIAESTLGATASSIPGLDIAHQPERGKDREVDFVFTVGDWRLPVEVKYQRRIDPVRDTLGLRSFVEKSANRAPFGLLITQTDPQTEDAPHVVSMPLSTFMLLV